ncbi:hypothetical protein T01_6288 [Trichinella spiralis]|uniref:Uncharacterized protein n=1 Tax=Trichinella spiralis TaxID=6334 RepID=A0A0V1BSF4_TRISP|nr:hypothetical protein T01_6288 [Trichinella spiralis]
MNVISNLNCYRVFGHQTMLGVDSHRALFALCSRLRSVNNTTEEPHFSSLAQNQQACCEARLRIARNLAIKANQEMIPSDTKTLTNYPNINQQIPAS